MGGSRFAGPPAEPDDTEQAAKERIAPWVDAHPAVVAAVPKHQPHVRKASR